ncbi:unnamed protein product [Prorocentrum cordatum]|uniref:Uncharacterized protein n=1 Tax=Prorocentrum cordatum TaxID=2364126 RepID=A0ABN9PV54_9DINO|nr:unnamed protein product [Polarella glacialis]
MGVRRPIPLGRVRTSRFGAPSLGIGDSSGELATCKDYRILPPTEGSERNWATGFPQRAKISRLLVDMVSFVSVSEEENQDLRITCGFQIMIQRVCRWHEKDRAEEAGQFLGIQPACDSRVSNATVLAVAGRRLIGETVIKRQMLFMGQLARRPDSDPVGQYGFQPGGIDLRPPP